VSRPCELWLRLDNSDHDQFAAAMMLCEDSSGSCVHTGFCSREGDCFRSDYAAYRRAARICENAAELESPMVASALREAAQHLRAQAGQSK
jgi:hypothetical protein